MDSKKAILMLGLLAMALISSVMSARDLTETSTDAKKEVVEKTNEVNDAKYGGYNHGGYNHGGGYNGGGGHGGHGGYNRGGGHGGRGAAESVAVQTEEKTNEVNDARNGGGGGSFNKGGASYNHGRGSYHHG
ncbi:hypothetical protein MTR_5g084530 [Medicago truncatula]|uniref:Glycine rich protein n=1 Tax=Medicago truncatula TaxID=3880 RepID=A0A072UR25_MEDTR|nr:hypothetical protein MTR_5g084530 [Medicago truncatula]